MAEKLKMIPGPSFDLTGLDPDDNQPWDFSDPKKRAKAIDKVLSKESLLILGAPMCKAFSRLMGWNWKRMDPEKKEKMWNDGITHPTFCMELY